MTLAVAHRFRRRGQVNTVMARDPQTSLVVYRCLRTTFSAILPLDPELTDRRQRQLSSLHYGDVKNNPPEDYRGFRNQTSQINRGRWLLEARVQRYRQPPNRYAYDCREAAQSTAAEASSRQCTIPESQGGRKAFSEEWIVITTLFAPSV
jgi:hypothetical protein